MYLLRVPTDRIAKKSKMLPENSLIFLMLLYIYTTLPPGLWQNACTLRNLVVPI